MKSRVSTLRLLVIPALLVSLDAFATTYYCDNDPNTSTYPHCHTSGTGWSYHTDYNGDWNNDDRRSTNPNTSTFYRYTFGPIHTYTMYAWVANAAFTAEAVYWILNTNGRISHIHYMNQNTISRGWHSVGSGTGFALAVHQYHSNKTAGADIVRGVFSSTSATDPIAQSNAADDSMNTSDDGIDTAGNCSSLSSISDPSIAAIQQKMLNAVDNYSDVSGSFTLRFSNNQQDEKVDFQASQKDKRSFVRLADVRTGAVTEHAAESGSASTFYPSESTYETTAVSAEASTVPPQGPRFYQDAQCAPVYVHRSDPANAAFANEVTLPQNYAFWLTTAQSQIVDHQTILGRDATVIEGHPEDYLRQKLGATSFKMWVDDATGVLLGLEGTNDAGKSVFSIEVSNIQFDSGVEVTRGADIQTNGWQQLQIDQADVLDEQPQ